MKIEFQNRVVDVAEKYAKSLIDRKKAKEYKPKKQDKKQPEKED